MDYPHTANIVKKIISTTALAVVLTCGVHTVRAQAAAGKPAGDTVAMANDLIARKEIYKANKLLKGYVSRHAKDFNAVALNAQTSTWLTNYTDADTLYKQCMKLQPGNNQVKGDYILMLLYMGKYEKANKLIAELEKAGDSSSRTALLRARMLYYTGEPANAMGYVNEVLDSEPENAEANELYESLKEARALRIGITGSYLVDNQPYETYYGNIKIEQYSNRYLDLYATGSQYNFVQPRITEAQWATLNNKMYFPAAKLKLSYGGGFMKFPTTGKTDWTASLGLVEQFAPHLNLELNGERSPYLDTRRSIDSSLSIYRFSGKLNFQKREWSGQLAYVNNTFKDNNSINTTYGWLLVPVWITPISKIHLGYSVSYANANKSSYKSTKTLSEILNEYTPAYKITGVYDPYFTPAEMLTNSLLFSFGLDITRSVSFSLNGDIGTGTASNPYSTLIRDSAGPVHVGTAFTKEQFTPYDITTGFNIHPKGMWQISARYTYRSTFFFNSNYVSVGIEKGFAGSKKRQPKTGNSFGDRIMDAEQRLKALKSVADADMLDNTVKKIKEELEVLKAEQDKRLSLSEFTPESEEAVMLQDRRDNIEEMLKEIDAANATGNGSSLKERIKQLSAIRYHGSSGGESGK